MHNSDFITIDAEFAALIPPLASEEFELLEASIRTEGCRDALTVWRHDDRLILLDGHNRHKICTTHALPFSVNELAFETRGQATAWMIRNQLGRRNLNNFQRSVLALKLKPALEETGRQNMSAGGQGLANLPNLEQHNTRQLVADAAQVSPRTLTSVERILTEAPRAVYDAAWRGDLSVHRAEQLTKVLRDATPEVVLTVVERAESSGWDNTDVKQIAHQVKRAHVEKAREEDHRERAERAKSNLRCELYHSELSRLELPFESVDAIIVDPPYGEAWRGLYCEIAALASDVLKVGGSLVVMSGQIDLPYVMSALISTGMRYQWTFAYLTPGGQSAQLWTQRVNTFWKPLIWLTKGEYDGAWKGDVLKSDVNDNDKSMHDWQQSLSGMREIVRRFSRPDDVVLDPCMGSGTTGTVCMELARHFIGCDVDSAAVETARARLVHYA